MSGERMAARSALAATPGLRQVMTPAKWGVCQVVSTSRCLAKWCVFRTI